MEKQTQDGNPFPFTRLIEGLGKRPGDAMRLWETWLGTQLDQLSRNNRFLGQMGKAMEGSMLFRATLNRMVEEYLHGLRMPTLGDVQGVHGRLDELERVLDRLDARLDAFEAQSDALAARLDAFSDKSDALADRLEAALRADATAATDATDATAEAK